MTTPVARKACPSKNVAQSQSSDMVITVLDRRIGPIPQEVARELKKKANHGRIDRR